MRFHSLLPIALFLSLLWVAAPAAADRNAEASDDPVLAGVLDMLGAEISEPVIVRWLEASADTPRLPTSAEMVALREAGASDELLGLLLDRASRPSTAAPSTAAPSTAAPSTEPERAADSVPSTAAPSPAPAPVRRPTASTRPPAAAPASGPVETRFSLSYSPYVLDGEDEWDLFVYLDGEPLSYVPTGDLLGSDALEFVLPLEAGAHELRLAQERHGESRKGRALHESRVPKVGIPFVLEAGVPAEVEVVFSQSLLRSKNPIAYRVAQGGRVLAIDERMGGEPDVWAELCDDLELSLAGSEPSRSERRRLEKCVSWADLWSDSGSAAGARPTRAQILEALERFDYRPTPKNQRLR